MCTCLCLCRVWLGAGKCPRRTETLGSQSQTWNNARLWAAPGGCWELTLSPLQEGYKLLLLSTPEPSLWPLLF